MGLHRRLGFSTTNLRLPDVACWNTEAPRPLLPQLASAWAVKKQRSFKPPKASKFSPIPPSHNSLFFGTKAENWRLPKKGHKKLDFYFWAFCWIFMFFPVGSTVGSKTIWVSWPHGSRLRVLAFGQRHALSDFLFCSIVWPNKTRKYVTSK